MNTTTGNDAPNVLARKLDLAQRHPVRRLIVEHLRKHGPATPSQLAAAWNVPLNVVAYHCRKLETLGFARVGHRSQRRGAVVHHFELTPEAGALH